MNSSIPYTKDGKLEQCSVYADPYDPNPNNTNDCPEGYHYYGDVGPTIVTEVILLVTFVMF